MTFDPRFAPPASLCLEEILAATGGELVVGSAGTFTVCTDSRAAAPGTLFVALQGEVHDAHRFVPDVLATGAGALVSTVDPAWNPTGPLVRVRDTLIALGALGRHVLLRHGPSVAAVTGSVGKTSTRAMLSAILEQVTPTLSTDGNLNNRIGLPLTLLNVTDEHRAVALELGMSEPGEIRALAAICRPRVRVITRIAPVHLEFFDGIEGIADAKGELFEDARPGDVLIFPADDPTSARFPRPPGAVLVPIGSDAGSDAPVKPLEVESRGLLGTRALVELHGTRFEIDVPVPGRHQLQNALAAAAAAWSLGAREEAIQAGLLAVQVPGRRMNVDERAGVLVVDDAYNASPASVAAVLETVSRVPREGRRVAALGDMLELGSTAPELHADVGRTAAALGLDLLIGAGPLMKHAVDAAKSAGMHAVAVPDSEAAGAFLAGFLEPGDLLLLKGSRGTKMEAALDLAFPGEGT
jgi:UDP-N-acetylmuramoyl-tripeptide--D-alanyl-D-alanine ligase